MDNRRNRTNDTGKFNARDQTQVRDNSRVRLGAAYSYFAYPLVNASAKR